MEAKSFELSKDNATYRAEYCCPWSGICWSTENLHWKCIE